MADTSKRHYLSLLQEAEIIKKSLEENGIGNTSYEQICNMWDISFVELMRTKMPFIQLPDENIIRIVVDDEQYDMEYDHLQNIVGNEEFVTLLENNDFKDIDDTTEEDEQEVAQLESAFNIMKQRILELLDENTREEIILATNPVTNTEIITYKQRPATLVPRVYRDMDEESYTANCTEIAFAGLDTGVGTTHSAIMCATALAEKHKVAYLELNDTRHLQALERWLLGENERLLAKFTLANVDYYYDIDYLSFVSSYRDIYDFVIINFGPQYYNNNITQYIACSKKFMVASGTEWKYAEIQAFCNNCDYDDSHGIVFLIPFADEEIINIIKGLTPGNDVKPLDFCPNPLEPNDSVKEIYGELINRKQTSIVQSKRHRWFK